MGLKNDRIISSIPKDFPESTESNSCPHLNSKDKNGEQSKPSACPDASNSTNWTYPSPKMFWEAMNRKGTLPVHLKNPESAETQEELNWIVTIHNVVNEQCWQEIRKWERFRRVGCNATSSGLNDSDYRLQRFLGRPDDLSPRAWFKSNILGYRKPFDRHDWYVREGHAIRRYVIDFYVGNSGGDKDNNLGSFYLDVRPALDNFDALKLRIKKFICERVGK